MVGLQDVAEAWGVGSPSTRGACGLWVRVWGLGRRGFTPSLVLPLSVPREGQGREVCGSLEASANPGAFWGGRGIGLAPHYQLEKDELLLRKEPALQLYVCTGRGEELCWQ